MSDIKGLIIEPKNVIHFKGPYTDVVTSYLKLTNPTNRKICFKVKTTAPRRYCVRPNNGTVDPQSTTQIAVMLQPFDFDSQNDNRNKHKFMIQTMFEPEGDVDPDSMWKAYADQVMDCKLRCIFDNQLDQGTKLIEMRSSSIQGSNENPMEVYSTAEQITKSEPEDTEAPHSSHKPEDDGNNEATVRNLVEEIKHLKDENANLRREMMLQKEGLKKRFQSQSSKPSESGISFTKMKPGDSGETISILANSHTMILAFAALFIGIIMGRLF
ncbi:vesicle-associated membrane protein-associated protein A-like [Brevipalpus obovatus]|uniref:vesicle-associated membrane protein-associated protein A-like n=1 Tax=Brevipalpus obovatus TaxID=246614 RepID=UPI003D9FAF87